MPTGGELVVLQTGARYFAPTMVFGVAAVISMTLAYVEGDLVMSALTDKLVKEYVEPMDYEKFMELENTMPESYRS